MAAEDLSVEQIELSETFEEDIPNEQELKDAEREAAELIEDFEKIRRSPHNAVENDIRYWRIRAAETPLLTYPQEFALMTNMIEWRTRFMAELCRHPRVQDRIIALHRPLLSRIPRKSPMPGTVFRGIDPSGAPGSIRGIDAKAERFRERIGLNLKTLEGDAAKATPSLLRRRDTTARSLADEALQAPGIAALYEQRLRRVNGRISVLLAEHPLDPFILAKEFSVDGEGWSGFLEEVAQDAKRLSPAEWIRRVGLTPVMHRELAKKAAESYRGWKAARDHLVRANLRLVVSFVLKHAGGGISVADLIERANINLLRAVDKVDPWRGFKFSTYAVWWIRQAVQHAKKSQDRVVQTPAYLAEQRRQYFRTIEATTHATGILPRSREREADYAGCRTREERKAFHHMMASTVSIHMPMGRNDVALSDLMKDTNSPDAATEAARREERGSSTARILCDMMSRREREIVSARKGLGLPRPLTCEEINSFFEVHANRGKWKSSAHFASTDPKEVRGLLHAAAVRAGIREKDSRPSALKKAECSALAEMEDDRLETLFDGTDERERWILRLALNRTRDLAFTLEECGRFFGCTRERIRQIEKKVRKKLQTALSSSDVDTSLRLTSHYADPLLNRSLDSLGCRPHTCSVLTSADFFTLGDLIDCVQWFAAQSRVDLRSSVLPADTLRQCIERIDVDTMPNIENAGRITYREIRTCALRALEEKSSSVIEVPQTEPPAPVVPRVRRFDGVIRIDFGSGLPFDRPDAHRLVEDVHRILQNGGPPETRSFGFTVREMQDPIAQKRTICLDSLNLPVSLPDDQKREIISLLKRSSLIAPPPWKITPA